MLSKLIILLTSLSFSNMVEKESEEYMADEPNRIRDNKMLVSRDDNSIEVVSLSVNDSLSVKICMGGISLKFHDTVNTEIQDVILDDVTFFSSQVFQNKKGVYIKLNKPIPKGTVWEASARIVRSDNDKEYLINLIANPCPQTARERAEYKRVIYIKERDNIITQYSKILTPEDTILENSLGFPRKKSDRVRIYDIVANAGSDHIIFGLEIRPEQEIKKPDNVALIVLNDKQVNKIKTTVRYLETPSEVVTRRNGLQTLRYQMVVNVDKKYVTTNRFIYLMYLNLETKHYQYFKVDIKYHFDRLKKNGWNL